MNHLPRCLPAFLFLLPMWACKSTPKPVESNIPEVINLETYAPLPDDQRPVVHVTVKDGRGAQNTTNVNLRVPVFFGLGAEPGASSPPSLDAVSFLTMSALDSTKRVCSVSDEMAEKYKKMLGDKTMDADSQTARLVKPDFHLEVSVLEYAEVASSRKTKSYPFGTVSRGESVSCISVAYTITPLRKNGGQLMRGMAQGAQTSTMKGTAWSAGGWFTSANEQGTSPTMREALRKCIYDLTTKCINTVVPDPSSPEATRKAGLPASHAVESAAKDLKGETK